MLIFTQEFIEKVKNKYERPGVYFKPSIYYVIKINDENNIAFRNKIEQWVAELSKEEQNVIIPRLQSTELFMDTYHEIVVRNIFVNLGYQVELANIDGLTPDWFIKSPEGKEI